MAAAAIISAGTTVYEATRGTPKPPTPAPMPDQTQTLQAQRLLAARQASLQQGRASTILTNNQDTGDKLGP